MSGKDPRVPTKAKAIERKKRNKKIFDLRLAGASEAAIADVVGISSVQVHRILHQYVDMLNKELCVDAAKVKRMELERLDAMMLALWSNKNDPRAGDTLLRIMERRARYLGIDMPVKTENVNKQDGPIEHKLDLKKATTEQLSTMEDILKQLADGG